MNVREANHQDITKLVALDRKAYGEYGSSKEYFRKKMGCDNTKIIVAEKNGEISGFAVIETLEKNEIPEDFSDFKLQKPIKNTWAHIIAFTTETNYLDVTHDTKLLAVAEKLAERNGCIMFGVPLSINHPYAKHNVFRFWEQNGYKKTGSINWVVSPKEKIGCYFYQKPAQ